MSRPFVVRVGDLLREPGSRRDVDVAVDADRIETTVAHTVDGSPLELRGEISAMAGGVEVTGTVGFEWAGECRRCLEPVQGRETVSFREVAQRDPVDDEVLPIDGDLLDLEPLVRELVLAGLPLAPLCRDDCSGPDPERFPTTTETAQEAEAEAAGPTPDPRWAALEELRFDE